MALHFEHTCFRTAVLFHHTLSSSKPLTNTERTWQRDAVRWRPHMTTQAIWAPTSLVRTRWPWRKHLSMPRRFNLQPQGSDWYELLVLPQLIHPTYVTPNTGKHLTQKEKTLPYSTLHGRCYRYTTRTAALCSMQLGKRWIDAFSDRVCYLRARERKWYCILSPDGR
jgi:hypothetical protein